MRNHPLAVLALALSLTTTCLAACSKKAEPEKTPAKPDPAKPDPAKPDPAKPDPSMAPPPPPSQPQVIALGGFKTPESILWDQQADLYLVSNINGKPLDKDDNGFISRVSGPPDARVVTEAWIDGKSDKVNLDAPKGMALLGDTLYVADIDTVRLFDRTTGAPKGDIAIPGAMFLNDVAAGADAVYVSDSGLDAQFKPTPNQAVWQIRDGKATPIAKGEGLGAPNGLAVHGGEVWVATFGSGEVYRLDENGKRADVDKLPKGSLDGLVITADGRFFVSSWEAMAIFHGKPGRWTMGPLNLPSPADIDVDLPRNLILVPIFQQDRVEMHDIPRDAQRAP